MVAGDEFYSSECELDTPYVVHAKNEPYSQHGERLLFEKLVPAPYKANVYNIEVEDFHTYFVGFEGIWVHNKNTPVKVEVLNADRFPEATPQRMPEYNLNPNPFQVEVIRREQEIRNTLAKTGLDLLISQPNMS